MKTLIIEWQRLLDEQRKTCERCGSTEQEVEKAASSLTRELNPLGIDISLVKKAIDPESFKRDVLQSNKILIAGKTLEEWLGAGTGQSPCCEVCGDAECRTVEFADQTYETVPADLIVKAGLLAASQVFNVKLPQLDQRKSAIRILPKGCL
jgi:DNA repair exonuclease SbcCD ATPase subunit